MLSDERDRVHRSSPAEEIVADALFELVGEGRREEEGLGVRDALRAQRLADVVLVRPREEGVCLVEHEDLHLFPLDEAVVQQPRHLADRANRDMSDDLLPLRAPTASASPTPSAGAHSEDAGYHNPRPAVRGFHMLGHLLDVFHVLMNKLMGRSHDNRLGGPDRDRKIETLEDAQNESCGLPRPRLRLGQKCLIRELGDEGHRELLDQVRDAVFHLDLNAVQDALVKPHFLKGVHGLDVSPVVG
mmetsp:Transcript_3745/g.4323  ORF Transcript_3745/g.4323 Transcript_3745/m.4323 type:complete len:244 (-) Transcript_3745:154-885(-)